MKEIIQTAIDSLNEGPLKAKRITLGFDGCTDTIYKVVKKSGRDGQEYFSNIREFGNYIAQKSEISCSIELLDQSSKAGGNSTIFANAISKCGVQTSVVGLFGNTRIDDIFREVNSRCEMYSYGKNAFTLALEFNDGKIMLYPRLKIEGDAWQHIVSAVGEQNLKAVFCEADMIGLVNWGEIEYSTYIWEKILELLGGKADKGKQIIVDLSDCSRNAENEILDMLKLLEKLSEMRKVILSLNESEAKQLYCLYGGEASRDYSEVGRMLADRIRIDRLVLHSRKCCYTYEGGALWSMPTQFIEAPQLLTGAGDNFNAGYALGCLLGLSCQVCNTLGNASSSYYITHGESPDMGQLKRHLEQWLACLE